MRQSDLEPIEKKDRFIYFDVLKIIATFAVVMLHVSAQHWFYVKLKTPEWRAFNLYDGSVRFPVPLFVMISGALFLSADRPIKQIFGKYILRIVTAFLFWSVLYAAVSYFRGTPLIDAIKEAIKGHYHLWYLYMIAGLYLIVPLLRPIVQNRKLLLYFLILSFLVGIVVPQTVAILNVFRPNTAAFMQSVWDQTYLYLPFGYSFYFVLGYWLDRIEITKSKVILAAAFVVVGTSVTVLLTQWINYYMLNFKLQHKIVLFYQNQTVNVAMTAPVYPRKAAFSGTVFRRRAEMDHRIVQSDLRRISGSPDYDRRGKSVRARNGFVQRISVRSGDHGPCFSAVRSCVAGFEPNPVCKKVFRMNRSEIRAVRKERVVNEKTARRRRNEDR